MTDGSDVGATARAGATAGVPWRSRTVQVVLASTLLAPLGVPLVSPALPVVRDAFALTDAQASLLISAYFVTGIALSPLIGLVVDRVGRRRVLVPSLFVFSLLGGAIAVGPPYEVVLAVRFVQGTAAAGIFITTVTLVGDVFEGVQRNAVLGANTAVLSAGAALYPLVGGALATVSWNAPFAAYLVGLPVAVFAWVALEEPAGERQTRSLAYLRRVASVLSAREALVIYGTAFLVELLLFGAVLTALPFELAGAFALSAVGIGLVLTVAEAASVVAAALNGRLATRFDDYAIVAAGFASAAAGLVVTWAAASVVVVGLGAAFVGAGWGFVLPSVDDAVSEAVPTQFRAGALSFRNSTTFLGRAAGPLLFAGLAAGGSYRPLLLGAGVAAIGAAVAVYAVAPETAGE